LTRDQDSNRAIPAARKALETSWARTSSKHWRWISRHGAEAIERVRVQSPAAYLKVVASLLPNDVNLNHNNLHSLRDEQLLARLRLLTQQAAPLLAKAAEDGDDKLEPAPFRH